MAFFTGSLFFMVGAFTRKQMVVYLQGIILFAIYLIGVVYSKFGLNVQRDELPLATDEWNRRQISEA